MSIEEESAGTEVVCKGGQEVESFGAV